MRTRTLLQASLVAVAIAFGVAPAIAGGLTDYDVQKSQTWADALAICDVTKFLMSEPKLDSEVIIAPVPGGAEVALHRPYFLPPTNFYSEVMKEMYERVLKAGQVTPDAYSKARMRYARLMLPLYHGTMADEGFLADQMKLCYALAADTSGRARAQKSQAKH